MANTNSIEKNRFFIRGGSYHVASKLASLVTGTEPGGTGTGIAKELDLAKFEENAFAELGLNTSNILKAYTVNRLHRNQVMSEILMAFLGQQAGMMAIVFEYKNKPGVSEAIPTYLNGPIHPNNLGKVGLELVTE